MNPYKESEVSCQAIPPHDIEWTIILQAGAIFISVCIASYLVFISGFLLKTSAFNALLAIGLSVARWVAGAIYLALRVKRSWVANGLIFCAIFGLLSLLIESVISIYSDSLALSGLIFQVIEYFGISTVTTRLQWPQPEQFSECLGLERN